MSSFATAVRCRFKWNVVNYAAVANAWTLQMDVANLQRTPLQKICNAQICNVFVCNVWPLQTLICNEKKAFCNGFCPLQKAVYVVVGDMFQLDYKWEIVIGVAQLSHIFNGHVGM